MRFGAEGRCRQLRRRNPRGPRASDDDAIDRLNVEIFKATLDLEGSSSQRERPYRHVLIARSLERIGDNAVDIAEQAAFLETRHLRQFTDASTPRKRLDPSS